MPSISELLLEAGRARAAGHLGSGQAWGQGVQRLGDILRQGMSDYQGAQEAKQIGQMRDLQMQGQRAELAAGQRATEDASVLGSAVSGTLDPSAAEAQLTQGGYAHLVPTFRKTYQEAEAAKLAVTAKKREVEAAELDYMGALAMGVKPWLTEADGGAGAAKLAIQHAKEAGYDVRQLEQQVAANPKALPQLVEGLIKKSPTYSKMVGEEADRGLRLKQEDRAIKALEATEADRRTDNERQAATAAETARHNRTMEANAARNVTANDRLVQIMGPNGTPIWVREADAVGKPAAQAARAVTGQERQALAFYNRAQKATEDIAAPDKSGTSLEDRVSKSGVATQIGLQYAPNMLQTQDMQAYRQAQRAFTEARLRKESGAAIPTGEYENDAKTYFAQPGDDAATIEQKRKARAVVLDGLKFGSGKAYDEYYGQAPSNGGTGTIRARDPQGKLHEAPAGTPLPKGWKQE